MSVTKERHPSRVVRRSCAVAASAAAVVAVGTPARADVTYDPTGGLENWNGYRVYLSPATHSNSGQRGECYLEENVNGFLAANNATNAQFSDQHANLRERGYKVRIGNGDIFSAVANSNSWGADVHIPLHSNARPDVPCSQPSTAHGTWAIHEGNLFDELLGRHLAKRVGDQQEGLGQPSPGGNDQVCEAADCTGPGSLYEIRETDAVSGYVELEFHTWQTGATWLANANRWSWRIAGGIDAFLGSPR